MLKLALQSRFFVIFAALILLVGCETVPSARSRVPANLPSYLKEAAQAIQPLQDSGYEWQVHDPLVAGGSLSLTELLDFAISRYLDGETEQAKALASRISRHASLARIQQQGSTQVEPRYPTP